jgi:opacity protein-like surface antigen
MESQDRTEHKSLPDIGLSKEIWLSARVGHTPLISNRTNPIAIEIEGIFITKTDADRNSYIPSPFGADLDFKADALVKTVMANFLLRRPGGRIHPYGGFGLGWVRFDLEDVKFSLPTGWTFPGTESNDRSLGDMDDDVFGYQFLLGAAFDVTDRFSVDVGYRYFRTEPEFKFSGVAYDRFQAPIVLDVKMTYKQHLLGLGLTYWF